MGGYTAEDLLTGTTNQRLLLRVYDITSVTDVSTQGFTATNDEFKAIYSKEWLQQYQHVHYDPSWLSETGTVHDMIRHITGEWNRKQDMIPSNWISCTNSLHYAIWDIARRLQWRDEVHLDVLRRFAPGEYSSNYRGARSITVDAAKQIE